MARVSEVTLFRHFGSKENLLKTVVEANGPARHLEQTMHWDFTGDFEGDLLVIARVILEKLRDNLDMVRINLAEASHDEVHARIWCSMAQSIRGNLVAYFIRVSKLQGPINIPPVLAAQAFMGMLLAWVIERHIFQDSDLTPYDIDEVGVSFVRLFLYGCGLLKENSENN